VKVVGHQIHRYRRWFGALACSQATRLAAGAGVHLQLQASCGRRGFGDAAPWPGFGSGSSLKTITAQLEAAAEQLHGQELSEVMEIDDAVGELKLPSEGRHALELALLDLLAQEQERPLHELLGDGNRERIPVHRLIHDEEDAQRAAAAGASCVKLKLGASSLSEDLDRVRRIRRRVPAKLRLRIDVNGRWDLATAQEAERRLRPYAVEWLEQPLSNGDLGQLARFRSGSQIPIAVDECVRRLSDVDCIAAQQAADVVVIKPMFVGGLMAARAIYWRARDRKLRAIITHSLESCVGQAAAIQLAASLAGSLEVCGLAPHPPNAGSRATGAFVTVPRCAGLGAIPERPSGSPAKRERYTL